MSLPVSPESKRFLPTAAMIVLAGLVALGRQIDLFSVATGVALVPFVAYALSLFFIPTIRSLSSPDGVLLRVSQDVTKQLAKQYHIPRMRRERMRQVLAEHVRPVVVDQLERFWTDRTKAPVLEKEFEKHEARLFSLGTLAGAYILFGFGAWILAVSNPGSSVNIEVVRLGFLTGSLLLFSGMAFATALDRERRTYRRLLWEQIPLLMAAFKTPDSDYWAGRMKFIEDRRSKLSDAVAHRLIEEAEAARLLAVKAEFERDWVRRLLEKEASGDPEIAKRLSSYFLRAEQARLDSPRITSVLLRVMTGSLAIVSIVIALSETISGAVAASISVTLAAVTLAVVAYLFQARVSRTMRRSEDTLEKELEELLAKNRPLQSPSESNRSESSKQGDAEEAHK